MKDAVDAQYMKNRYPRGKPKRPRDALDELMSAERKEKEQTGNSSDLYSESESDMPKTKGDYDSDSSGQGTRFAHRTGIFSLDFPESPRMPKGKGKKSRQKYVTPVSMKMRDSDVTTSESDATTVMPTQTQELTVSAGGPPNSDSDVVIQPSGFITDRRKKRKSSSSRNRELEARGKYSNKSIRTKGNS